MNKDQSIITQVAAKIAADLTPNTDSVDTNIVAWTQAFDAVREALFDAHAFGEMVATSATTYTQPVEQQVQMVTNAFPTATQTQGMVGSIRIKGSQHGPIPEWLVSACAKDGVTEVWDNRDGLAVNPKRPWFKAVQGEQAYWEPKARK